MSLRSLPAAPADNHAFVVQVAVGKAHSMLLTDEGVIYSWTPWHGFCLLFDNVAQSVVIACRRGDDIDLLMGTNNEYGQLGRACHNQDKMLKPAPIIGGIKQEIIVQIACGLTCSCTYAGQLGVDGFSAAVPESELAVTAPTPVKHFEGQELLHSDDETSLCARSCSCGPESSACVTVRGEVYVWGAISYYMLGAQKRYDKAENCTVPVCIKSLPREAYAEDAGPDQDVLACSVAKLNIEDDMANLITSLKSRSSQLVSVRRMKRQGSVLLAHAWWHATKAWFPSRHLQDE
ncbi:unnamed protein product [Symbiodinium sp. CCMP2592]|nr:unnamed protein product [Symbiodinium sp. CCMP2592]